MIGLMLSLLLAGWAAGPDSADSVAVLIGPASARVLGPDTIEVAGTQLTLWGVSLDESERPCPDYAPGSTCLEGAVWELEHLIQNYEVRCEMTPEIGGPQPAARCEVRYDSCFGTSCEVVWRDLSEELIAAGVVTQNAAQTAGRYDEAEDTARCSLSGLWNELNAVGNDCG